MGYRHVRKKKQEELDCLGPGGRKLAENAEQQNMMIMMIMLALKNRVLKQRVRKVLEYIWIAMIKSLTSP